MRLSAKYIPSCECTPKWSTYPDGSPCLVLIDNLDGSVLCKATVSLPHNQPEVGHCYIKTWCENAGVMESLCAEGILSYTGRQIRAGFVCVSVCKILVQP